MSADTLRRAAARMRELAHDASWTESGETQRWSQQRPPFEDVVEPVVGEDCGCGGGVKLSEYAAHIAAWDPTVALAVALWLEWAADQERDIDNSAELSYALTVARRFLRIEEETDERHG